MSNCTHCGVRTYNDFGLGIYDYNTGSAACFKSPDGFHESDWAFPGDTAENRGPDQEAIHG